MLHYYLVFLLKKGKCKNLFQKHTRLLQKQRTRPTQKRVYKTAFEKNLNSKSFLDTQIKKQNLQPGFVPFGWLK